MMQRDMFAPQSAAELDVPFITVIKTVVVGPKAPSIVTHARVYAAFRLVIITSVSWDVGVNHVYALGVVPVSTSAHRCAVNRTVKLTDSSVEALTAGATLVGVISVLSLEGQGKLQK